MEFCLSEEQLAMGETLSKLLEVKCSLASIRDNANAQTISSLAISLALPPAQNGQDYSDPIAIIPVTCEMAVKFNDGCPVAMVSNSVGQRTPGTGYVAPMP